MGCLDDVKQGDGLLLNPSNADSFRPLMCIQLRRRTRTRTFPLPFFGILTRIAVSYL